MCPYINIFSYNRKLFNIHEKTQQQKELFLGGVVQQ